MIGTSLWVVVKTTAPTWCTLQVPGVVGAMLGLCPETERHARRLAFLDEGPGVARVVLLGDPANPEGSGADAPPAIAFARPTKDLLFTLPRAVQNHLGLKLVRRGVKKVRGTDDLVAWAIPEEDWTEGRSREDVEGTPLPRIFLVRSVFPAPATWRCTRAEPGPPPADPQRSQKAKVR